VFYLFIIAYRPLWLLAIIACHLKTAMPLIHLPPAFYNTSLLDNSLYHLVTLLTRFQLHKAGRACETIAAINFFE